MTKINTDHPVLVTGATGYVAGWLVRRLHDAPEVRPSATTEP